MLQGVTVCCSVMQCAAVLGSVLQCAAVCCSVLDCVAVRVSAWLCDATCCNLLYRVAVHCIVLQHFALRGSVVVCYSG